MQVVVDCCCFAFTDRVIFFVNVYIAFTPGDFLRPACVYKLVVLDKNRYLNRISGRRRA